MSEDLKPCPFCGDAEDLTITRINDSTLYWCFECESCDYNRYIFGNKEEAIKIWNTRPAEDALTAEIERLKADLEMQKNLTEEAFKESDKWQKMFYDFVEKRAKVSTNVIPIDIGKGGEDE